MGNKWVKVILGIIASGAIFVGVTAFVADLHVMRPYYDMANEGCSADIGYGHETRLDCFDHYTSVMRRSDANDQKVAIAAGLGAVVLFWILVHFFYVRPRRRREMAAATNA